ncbi:hypothetical protein Cantr_01323 [Candida viswanathii]|uniref:Uncharacterized protein n=1 Tax=Candida viswanathii TaxID=5486 RepID=A0A367YHV8_9ASCO|nr:hypothetical protein Cantr_01323 [Candida viswanathii]
MLVTKDVENIRHVLSGAEMKNWNLGYRPLALRPLMVKASLLARTNHHVHGAIRTAVDQLIKDHTESQWTCRRSSIYLPSTMQHTFYWVKAVTHEGTPGEESACTLDPSLSKAFASQFNSSQQQMTIRFSLGKFAFLLFPKSLKDVSKHSTTLSITSLIE